MSRTSVMYIEYRKNNDSPWRWIRPLMPSKDIDWAEDDHAYMVDTTGTDNKEEYKLLKNVPLSDDYITKNKEKTIVSIYRMKISTNKNYLLTSKKSFIQASKEGDYILYYSPGPSEQKNTRLSIIRCDGKNNINLADFYVS